MADALDTKAVLNQLMTLVGALPAFTGAVTKGVPKDLAKRQSAFIALGGQDPVRKTTGNLIQRRARYVVTFGYRVGGDQASAEDAIADAEDALIGAVYADATLGGTCDTAEVLGSPDDIVYRPLAGVEFRLHAVVIEATQRQTF